MAADTAETRPDPDALLATFQREQRGRLKVFLGAAPGVGKTWEMLAAANQKREAGVDVVAGLIETHGRAGTNAEIGDLEILPRLAVPYRGQMLEEFDLDAALARRPVLLLIDELAHTNAPGLRHEKRWQDVKEILDAGGIDVWTTLNIQHLESLNDPVARITGVRVSETIPDTVLDLADEIELVDLPPAELQGRLREGKIYRPDVAERALQGFFRQGNLGALREMALRRVAQHVDRDVTSYMRARAIPGPWPAAERVMALIGPDPSANNVVRHAARLADALRAPAVAFHVERPNDDTNVQAALDLMVQLGGTVATTTTADVARAALEYAARQNITHIVVGRAGGRGVFWRRGMSEVLTRRALAFTLHVVPLPAAPATRPKPARPAISWQPYPVIAASLAAVTGAGIGLRQFIPQEAMGLFFTALIAAAASRYGRAPGLATAIVSFLLWDFCFLPPVYTFSVGDPRDAVALGVFLIVGLVTGTLAGRVRAEAQTASTRIEALRRISLFGQRFSHAATPADLLRDVAAEAAAITTAGVVLTARNGVLAPGAASPAETTLDEAASAAADWSFRNAIETGIGTGTLPSVPWRFMPLRAAGGKPFGVLGARPNGVPPGTAGADACRFGRSGVDGSGRGAADGCGGAGRCQAGQPEAAHSTPVFARPRSAHAVDRDPRRRRNPRRIRRRAKRRNARRSAQQHRRGCRPDDPVPRQHHGNGAGRDRRDQPAAGAGATGRSGRGGDRQGARCDHGRAEHSRGRCLCDGGPGAARTGAGEPARQRGEVHAGRRPDHGRRRTQRRPRAARGGR